MRHPTSRTALEAQSESGTAPAGCQPNWQDIVTAAAFVRQGENGLLSTISVMVWLIPRF